MRLIACGLLVLLVGCVSPDAHYRIGRQWHSHEDANVKLDDCNGCAEIWNALATEDEVVRFVPALIEQKLKDVTDAGE